MTDLFQNDPPPDAAAGAPSDNAPLADRLRPRALDEVAGRRSDRRGRAIGRMVAAASGPRDLWVRPARQETIARLLADG